MAFNGAAASLGLGRDSRRVTYGNEGDLAAVAGSGVGVDKPARRFPSLPQVLVGLLLMGMIIMVPLWNSIAMLYDPVFRYFCGTDAGHAIILFSSLVLGFYLVSIVILSAKTPNEQTALYVTGFFLTVLGMAYLNFYFSWFSQPRSVSTQIWTDCYGGADTAKVYRKSQELYALRRQPECFVKKTVENCDGFVRDDESDVIKHMESDLSCSGFCYDVFLSQLTGADVFLDAAKDSSYAPPSSTDNNKFSDALSLLQTMLTTQTQHGKQGPSIPATEPAPASPAEPAVGLSSLSTRPGLAPGPDPKKVAVIKHLLASTTMPDSTTLDVASKIAEAMEDEDLPSQAEVNAAFPPNTMYPPTLFSKDDWQASCNGMTGRLMISYGNDVGDVFFAEGAFLLITAIVISGLMLFSICFAEAPQKPKLREEAHRLVIT